jgi:hypothetical protein
LEEARRVTRDTEYQMRQTQRLYEQVRPIPHASTPAPPTPHAAAHPTPAAAHPTPPPTPRPPHRSRVPSLLTTARAPSRRRTRRSSGCSSSRPKPTTPSTS